MHKRGGVVLRGSRLNNRAAVFKYRGVVVHAMNLIYGPGEMGAFAKVSIPEALVNVVMCIGMAGLLGMFLVGGVMQYVG